MVPVQRRQINVSALSVSYFRSVNSLTTNKRERRDKDMYKKRKAEENNSNTILRLLFGSHLAQLHVSAPGSHSWLNQLGLIRLFSKICYQIPCPRANHSGQMQPNFPTPGCTLLSIPRQNPRKAQ